MTQQIINPNSTAPNDGQGDSPYNGMVKINANFTELYTRMAAAETGLAAKAPLASPTFTGTVGGITAAMVGLSNVNNTSDANKPTSTAQQASIDAGDILRLEVSDIYNDFVASGLATPVPTNSLTGVMAPGIAYIQGKRTVQLISNAALTFTYAATRDTYNDMDSAGNITHVAVTNGATEPAVTANCLRIEKVVTDGTKITSVTQKAPKLAAKTVPIYFQLDGNGNIIANFVPRTGTIIGTPGTNLQDITNAGNGEPAVATDIDAIVIYKGSPSAAKIYTRSTYLGSMSFEPLGDTAIANNGVIQLDPASVDLTGLLTNGALSPSINNSSAANNYLDFTAVKTVLGNVLFEIQGQVIWVSGTTYDGTYRGVEVQESIIPTGFISTRLKNEAFVAPSSFAASTSLPKTVSGANYIRFRAKHNATVLPDIQPSGLALSGFITVNVYLNA